MASTAERLKAAQARDEEGIEQDETPGSDFAPPPQTEDSEPEPEPTEPTPEPEPAPEPEPSGMSAAQAGELEKATTAYIKRVEKVFGPGNVPPPCSHCEGLGFDLTGGEGAPDFPEHEQYKACDECGGLGNVKTGSKVAGHDLHECPKCIGRGYLERLPTPTAVPDQQDAYGTPAWMGTVQGTPAQ